MSVAERAEEKVDLRCPYGARALLAKIVQQGGEAHRTNENLMELACRDCARRERQKDSNIRRVLHRFNVLGELVESVVER